jgi:flagellar basal body-associated protein FliL
MVKKKHGVMIETPMEARQAEPSILLLLIISVSIAVIAIAFVWFLFFRT